MGPIKEPRSTDHEGGRLGAAGWRWRGLDGGHGSSMLPRDVASTADRCLLGPYPAGTCSGDSEHATYRDVRALGSSRSRCGPGYAHRQLQPRNSESLKKTFCQYNFKVRTSISECAQLIQECAHLIQECAHPNQNSNKSTNLNWVQLLLPSKPPP
jgi:hypothetical protein